MSYIHVKCVVRVQSTYKFKRAFFRHAQIWHACADRDETGSHQKQLTNPTPEGFRGLFIDVCGMLVGGMIQAGGREETPRTADVTVTKIAGYVRVRILMNR